MLPQIQALLVLQDRDQRLLAVEKDLAKIPDDEKRASTHLSDDQRAVETAKAAVMANEVAIKSVELDIQTRRQTVVRLKNQQFETRKNEEFSALGHEVTRYEAQVDELETRELELMEKADGLKVVLKAAEAALALTQRGVDQELSELRERAANRRAEAAEVLAKRKELAAAIDDSLLSLYDRLMKAKAGQAVVAVTQGQCAGCHMRLIPSTLIKVQAAQEITQCENCGRILFEL
jgi:predicted  nucleic acid-binding Zn-ribbon protein